MIQCRKFKQQKSFKLHVIVVLALHLLKMQNWYLSCIIWNQFFYACCLLLLLLFVYCYYYLLLLLLFVVVIIICCCYYYLFIASLLQRARGSTGDILKLAEKQKTLIHPLPSDKNEKS